MSWPPAALDLSRQLDDSLRGGGSSRGPDAVPVRSFSDPAVVYHVLIGLDGECTCTCADFERRNHDCKHIRHVKENYMTTAIVPIKVQPPATVLPSAEEWQSMDMAVAHLAETQSIALPTNLKTKGDIRAVIMAGWEIGVRPMTALRHIAVINGKTEPDGQLQAGIVMAKEPDASFEITLDDGDSTTVRLRRPSKNIDKEYTYTMQDAKTAGLAGKGAWAQYPRDMRRWAAVKRLCRAYCPDLINGIASVTLGDLPSVEPEPLDDPFIEGESKVLDAGLPPVFDEASLYSEGDDPEAPVEPEEAEQAPAPPPPADAPSFDAVTTAITKALEDCKQTWSPTDYGALYRSLVDQYMPPESAGRFNVLQLNYEQATAILASLRARRGEPEPEPAAT